MATQDQSKVIEIAVEDSDDVKKLLSIMDALGDSMSQKDREKYQGLIDRARASANSAGA